MEEKQGEALRGLGTVISLRPELDTKRTFPFILYPLKNLGNDLSVRNQPYALPSS